MKKLISFTCLIFIFLIYSIWYHPNIIARTLNIFDQKVKESRLNYTENLSWKEQHKPNAEGIFYAPELIFNFESYVLLQTSQKIIRDPLLGSQWPLFFLAYYMNKSEDQILIKMTFVDSMEIESFRSYMVRNLVPHDYLDESVVHDILTINSTFEFFNDEIPKNTCLTFHFNAKNNTITEYINDNNFFRTNSEETYYHFLYHFFELRGNAFSFKSGVFRSIGPQDNFLATYQVRK